MDRVQIAMGYSAMGAAIGGMFSHNSIVYPLFGVCYFLLLYSLADHYTI